MIKKYTQTGFVFALILFIVAQMAAQNPMQDSLQKQFRTYQENSLQEKIYLHTDKDVYLTGEIGWFKIYAVDAFFNKPLDVSKVVYVEVLDKNNKAVWQTKIALNKGFGNGSLSLPWAINSGKYKLRAYTNWMKNASTDYFFEKTITIINTKEVYEKDSLPQEAKYFVRFFPEGGNLVNGIQSTIAFHVTDKNGNGVLCNGLIINGENDTITQFLPLKFGMGRFTLTPKTNETYKAIVTLSNGEKVTAVLPKVFTEGYVMHLAEVGNQIKISVQTNVATPPSVIYLFAHTRGVVKTAITRPCLNGLATFLIDKNKMGDGISHFTVFNADRQAVCERLYFQYPKQRLALDMVLDEQSFGLRKKVNIHITTKNQDEKPTAANLSMAVYKIDACNGDEDR